MKDIEGSSRKVLLQSGHFSRDLEEVKGATQISGQGVFQDDGTCAKALDGARAGSVCSRKSREA